MRSLGGREGREHVDLGARECGADLRASAEQAGGRPAREVSRWSEWVLAGDLINQRNGFGSYLSRLDSEPGQIRDPGGECRVRRRHQSTDLWGQREAA